jgi:hypothetical protein
MSLGLLLYKSLKVKLTSQLIFLQNVFFSKWYFCERDSLVDGTKGDNKIMVDQDFICVFSLKVLWSI